MADMTDAQASQALRGFLAGVKYVQRLDEALTVALDTQRRIVEAKAKADSMEAAGAMLATATKEAETTRVEVLAALAKERAALVAAQDETKRELGRTQQATMERLDAIARDTRQAKDELLAVEGQIAVAREALSAAKGDLAAFHARVSGLAQ